MSLNDAIAIVTIPETGNCKIDIAKVVKCFNENCIISRWHDEYRLIEVDTAYDVKIKISIEKKDALELISRLNLIENKSPLFNNASTFRLKD